jgi:DNA-binding PadR family transcriptional regulator
MSERFEMRVLRAIQQLGGNAYGVTIKSQMGRTGREPMSYGSIYLAIDSLEQKGLIFTYEGAIANVRGGRRKRMCRLSANGELALKETA